MLAPAAIKRLIEPEEVAERGRLPVLAGRRVRSPARRSSWTAGGAPTERATGQNAGRGASLRAVPACAAAAGRRPSSSSCCSRTPPAIEFERPLVRARAGGADGGELAELERAKLLALQVRGPSLERRRRREAELSALFDTASDLAGAARRRRGAARDRAPGPPAARHRRRLPDAQRRRRAATPTCGSPTARSPPASRRCGCRMGAGLGGLVAQTGRAVRHRRLLRRRPLPAHRTRSTTACARRASSPSSACRCVRGSRVIGVLFAADRTERAVRPRRRWRCSARWPRTRRSPSTTPGCSRRPGPRWTSCRRPAASSARTARRWSGPPAAHDRFIDVVLRGGGVEDVAAAVTEVLGGTHHRARRGGPGDPGRTPATGRPDCRPTRPAALTLARRPGRTVRDGSWWTAAVTVDSELLGALVLHRGRRAVRRRPAHPGARRPGHRAAAALPPDRRRGREPGARRAARGAAQPRPSATRTALRERARRLGADLDRAARGRRGPGRGAVPARGRWPRPRTWRRPAAAWPARTTAASCSACPTSTPGAGRDARCAASWAAPGRPVTVGGGGPARGPGAVAAAHAEAAPLRRDAASRSAGRADAASADELGFFGLLVGDGRDVRGFVDATLGARARVRRPPRHRPGGHAAGLLRRRRLPGPRGRGAARARQHGHPAAGPGRPAARQGLAHARSARWRSSSPCGCTASPARSRTRPASYPGRGAPGPSLTLPVLPRPTSGRRAPPRTRRGSTAGRRRTASAAAGARRTRSWTSSSPTTRRRRAGCAAGTPGPGVAPRRAALRTPRWRWYATGRRRHGAPRRRRLPRRPRRHRPLRPAAARRHGRAGRRSAAASACTSGRWSTATASTRHPVPLRLGQARHGRRRRGAPDPVHPLRRVPVLHPARRAGATGCSRPGRRQPELEQPGCLHASMDLYKWAYKLSPATPGELVADCFELAVEIRELDMRASPYDLRAHGYEPVAIETAGGQGRVRRRAARVRRARRRPPGPAARASATRCPTRRRTVAR